VDKVPNAPSLVRVNQQEKHPALTLAGAADRHPLFPDPTSTRWAQISGAQSCLNARAAEIVSP